MFGHIHNSNERRIGTKQNVWDQIKDGQLMNVVIDTEGSGAGRNNQGYSTPNYEFFSEIGTARLDIFDNYLDSFQIFPRAPEWLAFEPGSPLVQRLVTQPELFDDEERIAYWNAMAYWKDYADRSPFAYKDFGDKPVTVDFRDYNAQFKAGTDEAEKDARGVFKPASERVIKIKMRDAETGALVEDVWYMLDRQAVARRISEDPDSPFYEKRGKSFLYDEETQSIWKVSPASCQYTFFNAPYDWPRLRLNDYRTGTPSVNTGFMNSRATGLNFQRPKNTVVDYMDMAHAAALHGPKGENGFDFPKYVDENGLIRTRATLSEFIDFHSGQANPLRLNKPGAFMPDDGGKHDDIFDHGAVVDAVGTAALGTIIKDRVPWVAKNYYHQRNPRRVYDVLSRKEPTGSKWNLFSMADRKKGGAPYDGLYYFLGPDDTAGKMKKMVFLRCDGTLHSHRFEEFGNKRLHELSVDELEQVLGDRDGPVRIETENYFPSAAHIDDVLKYSPRAQTIKDGLHEDVGEDYNYITKHEQMERDIMAALARRTMRFKNKSRLDVTLMEDELNSLYAGEVPYIVPPDMLQSVTEKGPQSLPDIVLKIHKDQNDVYQKHLSDKDDALMQIAVQANPIINFAGFDPDDFVHREKDERGLPTSVASEAARALSGYNELVKRLYNTKYKKKKWPYKAILDSIENPATGKPFIDKGKVAFETVGEAYAFRDALRKRIMEDTVTAIRQGKKRVVDGHVTMDFDEPPADSRQRHLLIFADANNGQDGNLPKVIDAKTGAFIDYDTLYAMDFSDVEEKFDSGEWVHRFYRMSSEPSTLRLVHCLINEKREDEIPEELMELYVREFFYRMKLIPGETVTTARIPNLETMMDALNHDKDLQDMARDHEEGQRILGLVRNWVGKKHKEVKAREKQFPALITGFEPGTDEPLDHISHEIRRDPNVPLDKDPNFVVIDLPLEVVANKIEQYDTNLSPKGLVVRNLDAKTRTQINKGKPVLVRTPHGQIFTTGPAEIAALKNPEDAALSTIMKTAHNAYDDAGESLKDKDSLYYLGIEDLYPLAATRDIKWDMQTLDMPFNQYYGSFAANFARMPEGRLLRAAFIPEAYCPQLLLPGNVRFREVEGKMFSQIDGALGKPTGHITETRLTDIWGVDNDTGQKDGIPLGKLIEMIKSGELPEKVVQDAGFLAGQQIERHFQEQLTSAKFRGHPMEERFLLAKFDQVNKGYIEGGQDESKNKMAFIQAGSNPPKATMLRFGRPTYPSEYRPLMPKKRL